MTELKIVQREVPQLMGYSHGSKLHIRHFIDGHDPVARPLCALNTYSGGTFVTRRNLVDIPIGLLCEKCKRKLPVGRYHFSGGVYTVYPNGTRSLAPTDDRLLQAARAALDTVAKNGRDVVRPPSKQAPVRKETHTKPVERTRQTIGDMLRRR